jgi:uncharacterized OsmC-like protein
LRRRRDRAAGAGAAREIGYPDAYGSQEGVDVTITHDRQHAKDCADCMTQSGFIHRFRVEITLHGPLSDTQKQELLKVAGRCPVAKTLQSEIRIDEMLA